MARQVSDAAATAMLIAAGAVTADGTAVGAAVGAAGANASLVLTLTLSLTRTLTRTRTRTRTLALTLTLTLTRRRDGGRGCAAAAARQPERAALPQPQVSPSAPGAGPPAYRYLPRAARYLLPATCYSLLATRCLQLATCYTACSCCSFTSVRLPPPTRCCWRPTTWASLTAAITARTCSGSPMPSSAPSCPSGGRLRRKQGGSSLQPAGSPEADSSARSRLRPPQALTSLGHSAT